MENALLLGLSRQVALGRELETVANNLANINTTGYKADRTIFEQFLMPLASADDLPAASRQLSFVRDRATWHNMSTGPILRTGSPLDVAIDGDGFLVVQTPRGQRYTRNGALSLNATGQLVTSEGYQVMGDGGPIQFQQNDHDIVISPNGIITVKEGASPTEAQRGRLQVAGFAQPTLLQKDGSSTFMPPNGVTAGPAPQGTRVIQGAIEKSNVNAIAEMARMIKVTRSYSDVAAILQQEGDLRRGALQQLSQPPTA